MGHVGNIANNITTLPSQREERDLVACKRCHYEWRPTKRLVAMLCVSCGSFEVEKKVDLGLDLAR